MKIYYNGDSNTHGTELENITEEAFAYRLAVKLNATDVRNDASPGASNTKIIRTTHEYLYSCKLKNEFPNLIVIGWTTSEREDWYYDGEYRSLNSFNLNMDTAQAYDLKRYEYWKNHTSDDAYIASMCKVYDREIFNLHCEMQELKIPHLFFNAIRTFERSVNDLQSIKTSLYHYNYGKNFIDPYSSTFTMINWALDHGYKPTDWWHFNADAHMEFSELLFKYITNNDILNP